MYTYILVYNKAPVFSSDKVFQYTSVAHRDLQVAYCLYIKG